MRLHDTNLTLTLSLSLTPTLTLTLVLALALTLTQTLSLFWWLFVFNSYALVEEVSKGVEDGFKQSLKTASHLSYRVQQNRLEQK